MKYVTSGLVRLTKPQLVGTLTGLLLAALLAAIDQTIVGTAEPRIIASLSGFDRYPWVATAYLLTSTLSVPIFASLSDIHGRKPFFLLGAVLFVVTSALCGMAGTLTFMPIDGMGQLILFRALQGIGAGMVMGLLFTIVGDIFSPSRTRTLRRAVLRGVGRGVDLRTDARRVADRSVVVARLLLGEPAGRRDRGGRDLDGVSPHETAGGRATPRLARFRHADRLRRAVAAGADLGDRSTAGASTRVESLLRVRDGDAGAFLTVESRSPDPMMPLELFRNPVITVCSVCVFVLGMGMFGVIIYLPLFMQGVLGVSATQSGNLLTPLMMGAVVGSFVERTDRVAHRQVQGGRGRRLGADRRRDDSVRADGSIDDPNLRRVRHDRRRTRDGARSNRSIPSRCRTSRRATRWAPRRRRRSFSDRSAARLAWQRSARSC